jgi:hypothetical protein
MIRQIFDGFDWKHVLFALVVLVAVPSLVIYGNRNAVDEQKAKEEKARLALICEMPLQPGEVDDPQCEEFRDKDGR